MYYENWYTLCDHLTIWFIYDEISFFWLSEVRIQPMVTPFLLASGLACIMQLAWHSNQWNHNNGLVYGRGVVDKCSITNDVGVCYLTWLQLSLFFFHPTTVFAMCQWHGPTWRGRNGNKDLGFWFMDCEPAFTPFSWPSSLSIVSGNMQQQQEWNIHIWNPKKRKDCISVIQCVFPF